MADEDADYADEDDFSEEEDGKLQRVEEHSGSTEYLSTEDEGEAGAPAAGAVFASGLDALMSAADAMPSEPLEHRTRGSPTAGPAGGRRGRRRTTTTGSASARRAARRRRPSGAAR